MDAERCGRLIVLCMAQMCNVCASPDTRAPVAECVYAADRAKQSKCVQRKREAFVAHFHCRARARLKAERIVSCCERYVLTCYDRQVYANAGVVGRMASTISRSACKASTYVRGAIDRSSLH